MREGFDFGKAAGGIRIRTAAQPACPVKRLAADRDVVSQSVFKIRVRFNPVETSVYNAGRRFDWIKFGVEIFSAGNDEQFAVIARPGRSGQVCGRQRNAAGKQNSSACELKQRPAPGKPFWSLLGGDYSRKVKVRPVIK